jgi:hypothetical protein
VDAISSLVAGTQRAQATVDAAAQQIAQADLPTAGVPDPTNPVAPMPLAATNVDVAEQLTTMMVATDMHQITTAALRSALALYSTSVDMLSTSDS